MKTKIFLATMLLGLAVNAQVSVDTLLIDEIAAHSAEQSEWPSAGLSMSNVEATYGQPLRKFDAVGSPPITRWEYAEYIVYFEHQTVLHSVRKRQLDSK